LLIVIVFLTVLNLKSCYKSEGKTTEKTTITKEVKQRKDSISHDSIINRKVITIYDTIRKTITKNVNQPLKKNEIL
ncbi:hypothetical protein, partial [Tenacibaculum aiptasiae]|uniref:hypothetical protein n=1 Tax=Tenacibaculum aiptasiae TaxID=426481 RepID=UPI00232A89C3